MKVRAGAPVVYALRRPWGFRNRLRQPAHRRAPSSRLARGGVDQGALFDNRAAHLGEASWPPESGLGLTPDQHVVHRPDQGRGSVAPAEALLVAGELME